MLPILYLLCLLDVIWLLVVFHTQFDEFVLIWVIVLLSVGAYFAITGIQSAAYNSGVYDHATGVVRIDTLQQTEIRIIEQ